jgi:hypothetical protein
MKHRNHKDRWRHDDADENEGYESGPDWRKAQADELGRMNGAAGHIDAIPAAPKERPTFTTPPGPALDMINVIAEDLTATLQRSDALERRSQIALWLIFVGVASGAAIGFYLGLISK